MGRAKVVVDEWGRQAKVNHDGVDGRLELCSPSKIMFDMDVCQCNNKIKIPLFKR